MDFNFDDEFEALNQVLADLEKAAPSKPSVKQPAVAAVPKVENESTNYILNTDFASELDFDFGFDTKEAPTTTTKKTTPVIPVLDLDLEESNVVAPSKQTFKVQGEIKPTPPPVNYSSLPPRREVSLPQTPEPEPEPVFPDNSYEPEQNVALEQPIVTEKVVEPSKPPPVNRPPPRPTRPSTNNETTTETQVASPPVTRRPNVPPPGTLRPSPPSNVQERFANQKPSGQANGTTPGRGPPVSPRGPPPGRASPSNPTVAPGPRGPPPGRLPTTATSPSDSAPTPRGPPPGRPPMMGVASNPLAGGPPPRPGPPPSVTNQQTNQPPVARETKPLNPALQQNINNAIQNKVKVFPGGEPQLLKSPTRPISTESVQTRTTTEPQKMNRPLTQPPTPPIIAKQDSLDDMPRPVMPPIRRNDSNENSENFNSNGLSSEEGSAALLTSTERSLPAYAAKGYKKQNEIPSISIVSDKHTEGYLWLCEKKDWKKRYFVLVEGVINVYDKKGGKKKESASLFSVLFKDYSDADVCFEVNSSECTYILAAATVQEKEQWKTEIARQKKQRREQRVLTVTHKDKDFDIEEFKRQQREKYEQEQKMIELQSKQKSNYNNGRQDIQELTKVLEQLFTLEAKFNELTNRIEDLNNKKREAALSEQYVLAAELKQQIEALETERRQIELQLSRQQTDFNNPHSGYGAPSLDLERIKLLEDRLTVLQSQKSEAVDREDFLTASQLKNEISQLESELSSLR